MLLMRKIYSASLLIALLFTPMITLAGEIDFKNFKITGKPEKYQLQTGLNIELTDYLHNALLNGVALRARLQLRLGEHRSWWFDKDRTLITVHYQLSYHALSQHYLLSRSDTGESWNFSTLPAALRKLGQLRKYTLPFIRPSSKNQNQYFLAVADMGPISLKLPLRIQSLFSKKYKLTSKGVLWPLH